MFDTYQEAYQYVYDIFVQYDTPRVCMYATWVTIYLLFEGITIVEVRLIANKWTLV